MAYTVRILTVYLVIYAGKIQEFYVNMSRNIYIFYTYIYLYAIYISILCGEMDGDIRIIKMQIW